MFCKYSFRNKYSFNKSKQNIHKINTPDQVVWLLPLSFFEPQMCCSIGRADHQAILQSGVTYTQANCLIWFVHKNKNYCSFSLSHSYLLYYFIIKYFLFFYFVFFLLLLFIFLSIFIL
jgi:hypothetical protein